LSKVAVRGELEQLLLADFAFFEQRPRLARAPTARSLGMAMPQRDAAHVAQARHDALFGIGSITPR